MRAERLPRKGKGVPQKEKITMLRTSKQGNIKEKKQKKGRTKRQKTRSKKNRQRAAK